MKQMNKMKKTKKIKTSVVLKTIVVLIALSSMLLNTMLGVSKAEYFKTFSKKFDFEANPDLKFEYLVHDSNGVTAENSTDRSVNYTGYTTKTGVYDSSKSFVQEIVIGGNKDDYIPKDGDKPYDINIIEINGSNIEYGGGLLSNDGEYTLYQDAITRPTSGTIVTMGSTTNEKVPVTLVKTITEEDVKRGYVILDIDVRESTATGNNYLQLHNLELEKS